MRCVPYAHEHGESDSCTIYHIHHCDKDSTANVSPLGGLTSLANSSAPLHTAEIGLGLGLQISQSHYHPPLVGLVPGLPHLCAQFNLRWREKRTQTGKVWNQGYAIGVQRTFLVKL